MDVYYEMLNELGYESFIDQNTPNDNIHHYDQKTSKIVQQVNHYSEFEWGVDASGNKIQGPSDSVVNLVLDYDQEQVAKRKRIHRYDRYLRFRYIFYQITGLSLKEIKPHVVQIVLKELKHVDPTQLWMHIRTILKRNNIKKHYNDIPAIIRIVTGQRIKNNIGLNIKAALEKFKVLSHAFDRYRDKIDCKYFPNMRYVAIKLAKEFNVDFPYHTPLTRILKKEKHLDTIYSQINHYYNLINIDNKMS